MLLKQVIYNDYNLKLYDNGQILKNSLIDIADIPILNELTKDLLEYYVEWEKQTEFVKKLYF